MDNVTKAEQAVADSKKDLQQKEANLATARGEAGIERQKAQFINLISILATLTNASNEYDRDIRENGEQFSKFDLPEDIKSVFPKWTFRKDIVKVFTDRLQGTQFNSLQEVVDSLKEETGA